MKSIYEVHIELIRDKQVSYETVSRSEIAAEIARKLIKQNDREHVISISLDGSNQPVNVNIAHIGSTTVSLVSPKDLIKPVILSNGSALIIAHNHPSGVLLPSEADKNITAKIREACKVLDLRFLDSIIIGSEGTDYYSFADEGMMEQ